MECSRLVVVDGGGIVVVTVVVVPAAVVVLATTVVAAIDLLSVVAAVLADMAGPPALTGIAVAAVPTHPRVGVPGCRMLIWEGTIDTRLAVAAHVTTVEAGMSSGYS